MKNNKLTSCILLLFCVCDFACCARILGVFHMAAPSHFILGSSLMKGLAEKGHDVTLVSSYSDKNIPKNLKYREIVLKGLVELLEQNKKEMFNRGTALTFIGPFFITWFGNKITETCLDDPELQKLIKSKEKFDVIIIEDFFNDAFKALAPHFGAHLILFSTSGVTSWVNSVTGNPAPLSFSPEVILGYPQKMNFGQRFMNCISYLLNALSREISYFLHNRLINKYFPGSPDLAAINYNLSLALVNSHVSVKEPVSLTRNMIEIGGFHIKPPEKLPADLQKFLDDAKEGVIYFSMGSNLRSANMHVEKREALLKAFSKLKQKVLWKWEEDVLPGQPPNVKTQKWLPQQSILAHPNVKVFITHGGLLSTTETIYHGVPILAIPIFADQNTNAATAVNNGYCVRLSYDDLNEKQLSEALNELLTNPKYKENAQRRSKLMHDRPLKPLDEAVYWIEYVIRTNGAHHFRSAALDLAWYQYLLLDVLAIVLIVTVASFYAISYAIKFLFRKNKNKDKLKKL